jgi:hypothetical protein
MRSGPLENPVGVPAYAAVAASSAAITADVDDAVYTTDGALALALDSSVVWVLQRTSTAPTGAQCILTKSGVGRWTSPTPSFISVNGGFGLGVPRVRQVFPNQVKQGLTRAGDTIDCHGAILLSIDGLPEILRTDPQYKCQIELGRYVASRKKKTRVHGTVAMPQGFYHPSPWPTAGSGSGGTRGGSQTLPNPAVARPSEWPVAGLNVGGGILVHVAEVFAPWCQVMDLTDVASGATNKTLSFTWKKNKRSRRYPGYYPVRPLGVFAFRYAFFDPSVKRWVSGAWSEDVFVRPKGWPVAVTPQGAFPGVDTALPDRASLVAIACTVGGRVR